MNPPAPWSQASALISGAGYGTQYKPAICDYNGTVFLAWATSSDSSSPPSTFSFTSWLPADNGWATPTTVSFPDSSMYQSNTSALVVFNAVLYAFVPNGSGLSIFSYNDSTFVHAGNWGSTWNTAIAAVVCDKTLHVVGSNGSDNDHLVWSWSDPGLTAVTGPSGFSANTTINESSTSNPALIVRGGSVVLLLLANTDGRGVLEDTLSKDTNTWSRTDTLDQSGNSGVSAAASPDGEHSWICFKKHNGRSNLMCHYKKKKTCWSSNYSMGSGDVLHGWNEAALVYSNDWVYAVWNTYKGGNPIYYSRRPMKELSTDSWMGELVDQSISISALSIPGTHDSATASYHNLITGSRVRCQDMSITEQLDAGIRYFDLRAGYQSADSPVAAYHGNFYLGLTFEQIFQFFYSWLSEHTSEAIIVQIKSDQDNASKQKVSNDVFDMINDDTNWVTTDTIPTLDQIQGKIQLVRRVPLPDKLDNTGTPFGVDATGWPWNKQATITYPTVGASHSNVSLVIEDFCSYDAKGATALENKTVRIKDFIDGAVASSDPNTWYIGYSSYMTDGGIPDTPENYVTAPIGGQTPLNTALEEYVQSKGGVWQECKCWNSSYGLSRVSYWNIDPGYYLDQRY
ncbi:hypothetical protein NM208_g291 [Fusarium decemcellulare]|uniref:Uncharacterized protein n=1 Tax=Fusarium decemcellulare TaxID=57161 RepID=A0ACC1SZU8_9HYPO|nr:hypothetical protein NM208_g291 [Fusarium decemcellulare]